MAKVTGPLNSIEARGSVGTLTYNSYRGKAIVKARAGPPGPATGTRLAMLQIGKGMSFNWSTIGDDSRAQWRAYAASHPETDWTGKLKLLSGHSWYVRLGVRQALLGNPPIPTPPAFIMDRNIPPIVIIPYPLQLNLEWDIPTWPDLFDFWIQLYVAGPYSAGHQPSIKDAVRIGENVLADGEWFSAPSPAGWVGAYVRLLHITGLVSTWQAFRLYTG